MAMNCLQCSWREKPVDVRREACIECSRRFTSSAQVRYGTNELSNKGQTIESYDGRSWMVDDRDVASEIHPEYTRSRKPSEYTSDKAEAQALSKNVGADISEGAFKYVRDFVFEFTALTDLQLCLLKALMRGVEKSTFARDHGLTPSAVNRIYQMMLDQSPIIRRFIVQSTGSAHGTRGRKSSKVRNLNEGESKQHRMRDVFIGTKQLEMDFANS